MRSEELRESAQPLRDKSRLFALRIVRLHHLKENHREFVLSKQVLRSGTAIGALVAEARFAESKSDLLHKLTIALKEASETEYWLQLLYDAQLITPKMHEDINGDLDELLRLLISSTKTIKKQTTKK